MARLVVEGDVTDPGYGGLPTPDVVIGDEVEWRIAGVPDGTSAGQPSLAFTLRLPDGRVVFWQTTWRLFAFAFWQFARRYGEKPDLVGTAIEGDLFGVGAPARLEVVADDAIDTAAFFECELCGAKRTPADFEGDDVERQQQMLQWAYRHYREKHPEWSPPVAPPGEI